MSERRKFTRSNIKSKNRGAKNYKISSTPTILSMIKFMMGNTILNLLKNK